MKVTLKHPVTGAVRTAKQGFSWTTLFFGFLVPLTRSDFKWSAIMFFVALLTFGISSLFFPFFYNKAYINDLVDAGYKTV